MEGHLNILKLFLDPDRLKSPFVTYKLLRTRGQEHLQLNRSEIGGQNYDTEHLRRRERRTSIDV